MKPQDKQQVLDSIVENTRAPQLRIVVIGRAGVAVAAELIGRGFNANDFVAVGRSATLPEGLPVIPKALLLNEFPASGSELKASDFSGRVKTHLEKADFVFIVGALGGLTGREIAPAITRIAKDMGHIVFGFVTLPFDCEGSLRQAKAAAALQLLKTYADGVLCLPNQKLWKLMPDNTPLQDAFKFSDMLLADAIHGLWRMLTCKGLIDVHLSELCMVIGGSHNQTVFGVAEVSGQHRARRVIEKLLASPTLDSGQALRQAEAIVVGVFGGPDLAMAEVNSVIEQLSRHCANIPLITGAAIDESLESKLIVAVFAGRKLGNQQDTVAKQIPESMPQSTLVPLASAVEPELELIQCETSPRPHTRIVPPPPEVTQEKIQELFSKQNQKGPIPKIPVRLRQGQLKLELVSKGRFDKSEPTIYKGEDLDLPTFIRRGVVLN